MIKHIVIILDDFDEDAVANIDEAMAGIACLDEAGVIITDKVESAIRHLQLTTVSGEAH